MAPECLVVWSWTVDLPVWATHFVAARHLPPGRTRELVAFAPDRVIRIGQLRRDHRLPIRGRLAPGADRQCAG